MSSISIKPYASIPSGATQEKVGAIVTFAVKTQVPGTDFEVSYNNTPLSLVSTLSTGNNFYVDFGNNIPFKNSAEVKHATPIYIDRTGGLSDLTDSGYVFNETLTYNDGFITPTSQILITDKTPAITGYCVGNSATTYCGIFTQSNLQTKFFANPSGLDSTRLNINLTRGTSANLDTTTSPYTNRFPSENIDNAFTLYSVVLPPTQTANQYELKFEDGSGDPLNDADVRFRLLSCVLQSIKITCAAPTKHDASDGTNNQYINNNSCTLKCMATRYIQYNTQDTLFNGGGSISIEPGNDTIVLPSRALFNNTSISATQANTGTYSAGISGTTATGSVVLYNGDTGNTNLRAYIEGGRASYYDTIDYGNAGGTQTCETYQIGGTGPTYWYATCITTGASGAKKTLKQAISKNSVTFTGTLNGHFSHSNVNNTSGDYDVYSLTISSSNFRGPAITAYDANLEGTIPNISGWVNECIYLF